MHPGSLIGNCDGVSGARDLAGNPAEWMPWNYREMLARAEV